MEKNDGFPKTFLGHPDQWRFKDLLDKLFNDPKPEHITEKVVQFLRSTPLPLDDFPVLLNTYSRTMLAKNENGYEAMAARWQKGAVSSIHGHPEYAFLMTLHGKLRLENYQQRDGGIYKTSTEMLPPGEFISAFGNQNTFDNHIHGVYAIENTLSIHISSQNATKGKVFTAFA